MKGEEKGMKVSRDATAWGNLKRLMVGGRMVVDTDREKIPTETCVKNKIYVQENTV